MRNIFLFLLLIPFVVNAQTAFISGFDTICQNELEAEVKVSFTGIPPFTFIYSINGVNQQSISTNLNPYTIKTKIEGNYNLFSFSDANSSGSISGGAMVKVFIPPVAIISTVSDTVQSLFPVMQFTDSSIGTIQILDWNFGDNTGNQIIINPIEYSTITHEFPSSNNGSPSIYQVILIAIDQNNCIDTTYKNIFVINNFWMYIPNSFTPDEDQINDKFCIEYNGIRESTFNFYIMNRSGDIIFDITDPLLLKCSLNGGWDGKNQDGDFLVPGTYIYEMYFQEDQGWKHTKYGEINLVR